MKILGQDGARAATKITNGYINTEISGGILSLMSRRPENLMQYLGEMHESHPDMFLLVDTHSHACVFPDTDKHGHIPDYGLFDMNVSAFELQDDESVTQVVTSVLDFQDSLGLSALTSPALTMQAFNDVNATVSLKMYQESARYMQRNLTETDKVYLTLVFSELALTQSSAMAQMLDRLCLFDVDGYYIVVQRQKADSAMWSSPDTLANLMYLVNALHEADYKVVVGYTDLWGVLLSAVGADYIAAGWFQTLRQYCQGFYINSSGGPGIPLYVSESLMAALYTNPDLRNIVNSPAGLGSRVIDAHYGASLLTNPGVAEWSDEAYALQHWRTVKNIVANFTNDVPANLDTLMGLIDDAQGLSAEIRNASVALDDRHDTRHLGVWKSAIEKYKSGVL